MVLQATRRLDDEEKNEVTLVASILAEKTYRESKVSTRRRSYLRKDEDDDDQSSYPDPTRMAFLRMMSVGDGVEKQLGQA